ncbi:MAG: Rrf2 family transcriptional regulator [Cytophagaceae bacterium]|nr:Rrf2 family transcriptional regulator [Cytophagaceae bacterium]MBL0301434.1 Rrf2 family transcriptional regulator [Cytophagaceae bacterium]
MISKTCGYAIRGMVLLSLEQNRDKKIGIQEIAEELSVPQHFMGKILQDLAKRGLIGSIKGPHGGFYCNNRTPELQLIEVIEAVDGLGILKKCFLGRDECSAINPCPMHDDFDGCRTAIFKVFASKTIADLVSSVDLGESVLMG